MKMRKSDNKGFTLVELIVVLVILAILAAVLVPALLGYIDKAKLSKDLEMAKACLNATQSVFTKQYAKNEYDEKESNDKNKYITVFKDDDVKVQGSGDTYLFKTKYEQQILDLVNDNPYILIIGTPKVTKEEFEKSSANKHKAYTATFVLYVKDKNSQPIFFNGEEWRYGDPWPGKGVNDFYYNGEKITLQFYIVSAPVNKGKDPWTTNGGGQESINHYLEETCKYKNVNYPF